ncbi:aldo/keto reductase [Salisediminibacterium beveridgei]|uniref:Oxidoreductase, aldo/keto reductase family n=1 Tax=Salisediminibacterium beveridgei TaxID=632773 RepID=A0A1D7QYY5_9BACI|nr:aldo/keto reductase [Salisediminibacterium beveridgei]AOM84219.1 Oxidoreductase, aldo/keto reductase family [Salisediminibacterium beveridgei]
MKKVQLGTSSLHSARIGLGCMRMAGQSAKEAAKVIDAAVESGMDLFDHADIYGKGVSEKIFSEGLKISDVKREDILIQSKCGIRSGWFDFSKEHILSSVDSSLKRLNTDYLDTLLLHRPDTLMEPEEVADAFDQLEKSGKVRVFGVSNQHPMQVDLLKKYVKQPLAINQLQLSLAHSPMIDGGFNVNMANEPAVVREGYILEYSRLNDMTIQPWSPFQHGMIEGVFIDNPLFPELNAKLSELALAKSVTPSAIAIAWILRHPANMQPIIGTMNPKRISEIAKADEVTLSRKEWYELYQAGGKDLP